jgi:hypothetical protein
VVDEWPHADPRKDGQRGMTKPIVAFRNFANAPKRFPFHLLEWDSVLIQEEARTEGVHKRGNEENIGHEREEVAGDWWTLHEEKLHKPPVQWVPDLSRG